MIRLVRPVFRAVLIGLAVAATSGGLSARKPDDKAPAKTAPLPAPAPAPEAVVLASPAPPEPLPMGWAGYPVPVVVRPAYGYIPPRGGVDQYGQPLLYPFTGYMPGYPYPGYTMVYPYPRTVSSYSFGPSIYPMTGPVGGGCWGAGYWGGGCWGAGCWW